MRKAWSSAIIVCVLPLLISCAALAPKGERIDSSSWLTFYESLGSMRHSLNAADLAELNQDLSFIDAYYLGQYLDGVDPEEGDTALIRALSGLSRQEIHALAADKRAQMLDHDKMISKP
jgi:hypothetical protein